MSARHAVWEVTRRELVERSRSRVLRISLLLLVILSVGGAIAAARITSGKPHDDIGVVGARSVALEPALRVQARSLDRGLDLHGFATVAAAQRAVRDGSVDVALIDGNRLLVKHDRNQTAVRLVRDAAATKAVLDRLRGAGLSTAQAIGVLTPRAVPVNVLDPRPHDYDRNLALLGVGLLVLFTVLVFFGQAVAQGVTEEKSSRVVELLLTTVSPRRLLAGKVLGIGVLGLALLAIPGVAALLAGRLAGGAGLPSAAPATIALLVLWFVLGYAFYSVAFAAVGALVSRQEDLNTAMLPVNAVLIASFYGSLIAVQTDPNGTFATIAGFLPPTAPMVVPARMVIGDMNALGLVAAVAIELLAIAGLIALAARVYERALLHMGAPLKLGRAITDASHRHPEQPLPRRLELTVRAAAVALVLSGALIGFSHPIAIALTALGMVLIVLLERQKRAARRLPLGH
jgi:ABC-2 type transport system permease protein